MEKMGVIRESKLPYSSPVVITWKKDGTNRVCVDFRKLNRITEFDPTPDAHGGPYPRCPRISKAKNMDPFGSGKHGRDLHAELLIPQHMKISI